MYLGRGAKDSDSGGIDDEEEGKGIPLKNLFSVGVAGQVGGTITASIRIGWANCSKL